MKKEDTSKKEERKPEEEKIEDKIESSQPITFVLMKKGDYSVHILIEEIKDCVQIQKNSDQLPYPTVKITCFDKSQRTEHPEAACTDYTFGEHFYFEKNNMSVEQLDSAKIVLEVYDSNNYKKRQDFFGIYEFDLEYIYNQPNHALQNFWLALANPEGEDMTEVRGFLKLSASVLHDNDPRVELNMKEGKDSDCMIPSQIKMEYKMVSFHIMKAEELPDMDSVFTEGKVNRSCDGFVEIQYLGISKKTSVVQMKNEIVTWNEIIDIPVSVPSVSQKIVLLVKDYDVGSKDDLIGSIEVKVSDIFNNKYLNLEYFNIYGSPFNKSGHYFDQMNTNAEIGSKWKGRILMKISYQKADTPAAKVRSIEDKELIKAAANLSRNNLWSVYAKVYNALYLPEKTASYSIQIAIQDSEALFPAKKAINGNIEWNIYKSLQVQSLSKSIDEVPDIFIYLVNSKNEAVCFQRVKASSFHLNDEIMIIKLIPDPCIGKVAELCKSGIVKVKICIINKASDPPLESLTKFKDDDSDKEEEEDLEKMISKPMNVITQFKQSYTVVANVYMSRYMISSDIDGANDPFITLTSINDEQTTSIKYQTINGIWNEKLIFYNVELDLNIKSTWPIFMLKVIDYDHLSQNDLLGYSYLWLSDSNYSINKTDLVKPKWHKIFLPKSNRNQGEVLISFYIFDQENMSKIQEINSIPETIPYSFEINILGLRDLKPLNLLPVKKSYIAFDMNSLNVTGKAEDSLLPIITQPKDCGENPTINTVIKFDIKLPKDDIFMPELQCQVYDHLLNGMVNPLLGIFLINVGALSRFTSRQIDEDLRILKSKVGMMLTQGLIQNTIIKQTESFKKAQGKQAMFKQPSKVMPLEPKRTYIVDEEIKLSRIKTDKANIGYLKRKTTVQRFEYTNEFIEHNKNDHNYFVILPQFKQFKIPGVKSNTPNDKNYDIEDLSKAPPDTEYFSIGYIRKPDTIESETGELFEKDYTQPENITKHYRRIYRKGLERVPELGLRPPFNQAMLKRGKDEDQTDELAIFVALADESNKIIRTYTNKEGVISEKEKQKKLKRREEFQRKIQNQGGVTNFLRNRNYGKFKGVVRICEKQKMDHYLKVIEANKANDPSMLLDLKNLNKYEQLTRSILVKSKIIIRVYVLELNDLAKKDEFSDSDPYIKIYLGGKMKKSEKKNRHNDQKNCKWYKHYDILSELPGDSSLKIEVWDYDPLFSDELIGYTIIDLEDRFFSDKWQEMKFKPIEVRALIHPDISSIQGCIYLWVELFEKKDRININPWQIAPEPETIVELRLIIWETEQMKCLDVEGTSDIYVNAYVNPKEKQSTDVHYRCQTGMGSFNWRIILPISLPKGNKTLTLQVYDNDIFASDDFICGAIIDLRDLLKIPKDLDVPIALTQEYVNGLSESDRKIFENIKFLSKPEDPDLIKFWVQCYKNNQKEGRVLCSLELLPKWKANICKVGLGRKEPNISPYLPPPFGRLTFYFNPFKMLNQFVGPRFRKKLYCGVCIVCLIVYLICIVPYLILHLSGELVSPFNYI